ncbi:TetR/AcrR family transcriptional regulator [Thermobifida alba]|jgi:AcrR family transcriptional regulator|uniref:TetR/AcrR family transcriptional regulator n=1 Tax=Thermobifida alba TaxID=53522 RepID=A0ABY4L4L6_THEAE|nr:TetR/AcrR family transcriptional regulator [Thermobifida alba]UPT22270.1 TetR/AcrR family transcriptional regulator [Thermobifida alba]
MTKTTYSSGETLRARKQRQTREAIHMAALRRTLEHGIENVTVAEISAEADVSTRTFFNYFPTKEDAILGLRDVRESITEDAAMESLMDREPTGDLLTDVAHLVRSVFSATLSGRTREQIWEAMTRYPQLRRRQLERVSLIEQRLGQVVARHLKTDERFADGSLDVDDAARMIVVVCAGAMRFAVHDPAAGKCASIEEIESRFDQTVELLRKVMRKLQ